MDDRQIERLKWRSRRGLLELDLVFTRFWENNKHLSEQDMRVLDSLLQLPDNDILDMIMERLPISGDAGRHEMIHRLQQENGLSTLHSMTICGDSNAT